MVNLIMKIQNKNGMIHGKKCMRKLIKSDVKFGKIKLKRHPQNSYLSAMKASFYMRKKKY